MQAMRSIRRLKDGRHRIKALVRSGLLPALMGSWGAGEPFFLVLRSGVRRYGGWSYKVGRVLLRDERCLVDLFLSLDEATVVQDPPDPLPPPSDGRLATISEFAGDMILQGRSSRTADLNPNPITT
jgi:hypothetical protein